MWYGITMFKTAGSVALAAVAIAKAIGAIL